MATKTAQTHYLNWFAEIASKLQSDYNQASGAEEGSDLFVSIECFQVSSAVKTRGRLIFQKNKQTVVYMTYDFRDNDALFAVYKSGVRPDESLTEEEAAKIKSNALYKVSIAYDDSSNAQTFHTRLTDLVSQGVSALGY